MNVKKVTRGYIYNHYSKVYSISYCGAQFLFSSLSRIGYNAGVNGWNYDAFDLGNGICITTGYRPIGEHVDIDKLRLYEQSAERILHDYNKPWTDREAELNKLLEKFVNEVLA